MSDMSEQFRDGRIITFYSYKGGIGRTMALANVAWILAANGYRVLVADWVWSRQGSTGSCIRS